jgi:hypothetical protein
MFWLFGAWHNIQKYTKLPAWYIALLFPLILHSYVFPSYVYVILFPSIVLFDRLIVVFNWTFSNEFTSKDVELIFVIDSGYISNTLLSLLSLKV